MKIIGVRFLQGHNTWQDYYFKTDIEELTLGDLLVVDSLNIPQVAEVVDLNPDLPIDFEVKKWVIDKVDTSKHKERIEKEKKLKEIKNKINKRKKEIEEIQILELLAEKDEEMKQLLEEFKKLSDF